MSLSTTYITDLPVLQESQIVGSDRFFVSHVNGSGWVSRSIDCSSLVDIVEGEAIQKFQETLDNSIVDLSNNFIVLSNQISTLTPEFYDVSAAVVKIGNCVNQNKLNISANSIKIDKLQESSNYENARIDDLSSKCNNISSFINTNIISNINHISSRLSIDEDAIKYSGRQISEISSGISNLCSETYVISSELSNLELKTEFISSIVSSYSDNSQKIEELSDSIDATIEILDETIESVSNNSKQIQSSILSIATISSSIDDIVGNSNSMEKKLNTISSRIDEGRLDDIPGIESRQQEISSRLGDVEYNQVRKCGIPYYGDPDETTLIDRYDLAILPEGEGIDVQISSSGWIHGAINMIDGYSIVSINNMEITGFQGDSTYRDFYLDKCFLFPVFKDDIVSFELSGNLNPDDPGYVSFIGCR